MRVCECVIEKQQSSYSSFSSDSPSLARGLCVLDLHGRLVWISCPAGAVARRLVYGRGERGGRLVAPPPIPLPSSLSSSSSTSSSSSSSWFSSCSFLAPTPSVPRPQMCLFMCRARWSDLEKHLQRQTETLCWKRPKNTPLPPTACTRWWWKIQKPETCLVDAWYPHQCGRKIKPKYVTILALFGGCHKAEYLTHCYLSIYLSPVLFYK